MHINHHLFAVVLLDLYCYLYLIVALYISTLNQESWYFAGHHFLKLIYGVA